MRLVRVTGSVLAVFFCVMQAVGQESAKPAADPLFQFQEVMIPMRDGVHLQTVILTPAHADKPLPILFRRTPYGVPEKAPNEMPPSWKELAEDGYIFVIQNLRGRFKSEGYFKLSSRVDLHDPKATNETTDAYDSIEWLVKNVGNNNGKVGMYGVSYDGLTTALALLNPHPALKAISEQASPVDQWMNDDFHRYGALRESYAIEYAVMEQADKNTNTHFEFETYDTFDWYLNLGPLSRVNDKYLHGKIPAWNEAVEHPDYDEYWKNEAWVRQLHASTVPNLNVAGFWDQEDPWGPWQIFRHAAEHDPSATNFIVAGPWFHGQWQTQKGESIGMIPFGGHETAREFREKIEAPFFRYYLHGSGEKPAWQASTFQAGSNTWHTYASWPPKEAMLKSLYFHSDGTLSFTAPAKAGKEASYREYVSDPANPVPYRTRPISPTYPGGDWRTWEVADQRFTEHRPDVLAYVSAPLDRDLVITGAVSAELFASTSGTDSDFVVKLIDVFPENYQKPDWDPDMGPKPGQFAQSLNGYELPVAMEVRRGRYLQGFETAHALTSNQPAKWDIPLRDHDYVFLKGHRIMVQIQSTWFPVIDRNPQRFVPSIYKALATDFRAATQRVYSSPERPSHVNLPVMP
ncbi:MAG: CocE/NonD family hydrolase [Acidobacteria bacterium]|nr:CocE/NonD family hydrolase [Acidobacteriota bacterium]MBS1867222.1 CocE/NonD family hydrolase [Acidobacteriota bacterium]